MMKNCKQLLLTIAFIVGISISASAQKEGDKRPPKEKPPVIVVNPDKKPKEEKPKEGKRPQAMIVNNNEETDFA